MKAFIMMMILSLSLPVFAESSEMQLFVVATKGNMSATNMPRGYKAVEVSNLVPKGVLKSFINTTLKKKQKDWHQYVYSSGNYDHVSAADRQRIAANPLAELEVASLLAIEQAYAIYKGKNLIGYFVELADYVQSAIYQDSAWYDIFVEPNFYIVEVYKKSA
jgi:hypothetical protein